MKRFCSILLVATSLAWSVRALAASRPHYGGTLRLALKKSPASLDPASLAAAGLATLSQSAFETLVELDDQGRPHPLLATSWQAEPGNQRWRFLLRSGVSFHDGTSLDSATVAACLRVANPEWKVLAVGDSVMIETETADPEIPAELALRRNGIFRRSASQLSGTGPFAITQWIPGKHVTLTANDRCWEGRPFLDAIEVEFDKNDHEQLVLLDLGKADVIEIAPENIRRAKTEGREVKPSEPEELIALVFVGNARSEEDIHGRNALAMSLDTASINNVVLQGGGEPTGALLPKWLSGYGFVFPSGGNLDIVRRERTQARHLPAWTLKYDASDSVARVIAERVLLNARDAGIALQITPAATADVRLVRIPLPSSEPHVALNELARALQLPQAKFNNGSVAELYSAENSLLQSRRVIPLIHLRNAFAMRANVHGWKMLSDGTLQLGSVWLSAEKP